MYVHVEKVIFEYDWAPMPSRCLRAIEASIAEIDFSLEDILHLPGESLMPIVVRVRFSKEAARLSRLLLVGLRIGIKRRGEERERERLVPGMRVKPVLLTLLLHFPLLQEIHLQCSPSKLLAPGLEMARADNSG